MRCFVGELFQKLGSDVRWKFGKRCLKARRSAIVTFGLVRVCSTCDLFNGQSCPLTYYARLRSAGSPIWSGKQLQISLPPCARLQSVLQSITSPWFSNFLRFTQVTEGVRESRCIRQLARHSASLRGGIRSNWDFEDRNLAAFQIFVLSARKLSQ